MDFIRNSTNDAKQSDGDQIAEEATVNTKRALAQLEEASEDSARQARQHQRERQDDKATMALLMFSFNDGLDVTRKMGSLESAICR